jgi:HlyD family secretion protein
MRNCTLGMLVVLLSCTCVIAQDVDVEAVVAEPVAAFFGVGGPEMVTVEAGPLKVVRTFTGVFESTAMTEVSVESEVFTLFKVVSAVPVGTVVKKGDVLVTFDREDYDTELIKRQSAHTVAQMRFEKAQAEMDLKIASSARDLESAQRAARITQEEHDRWVDLTEGQRDARLEIDAGSIELWRESSKEELRQLKEMYEADELIEDTETIILKRNEHYDKRAQLDYIRNKKEFQYRLQLDIPREREKKARDLEDSKLALQRIEIFNPLDLAIAQEQFTQTQRAHEKTVEEFAKFQADAELLTVTAPADGVVYYGQCVNGKWTTGAQMESALDVDGKVQPKQVFMTIVDPDALRVRASMAEANLFELTQGCAVVATPTGFPAERLSGQVADVTIAPSLGGRYVFVASLGTAGDNVMPGMTCKVRVTVADKPDALLVPAASVFTDADADERYVWFGGDEPTKQVVTVGFEADGKLEILSGLSEGDEILKDAPQD